MKPPAEATLEQALAYQAGWGREATAAHPECTCHRVGELVTDDSRKNCPMHGPKKPAGPLMESS